MDGKARTGRTLPRLFRMDESDGNPSGQYPCWIVTLPASRCASAFSAAVLITVRVAGSQQDLNLRPERLSPRSATNAPLYPAELCEPVYPLELKTATYPCAIDKQRKRWRPCHVCKNAASKFAGLRMPPLEASSHIPLPSCLALPG